MTGGGGVGVLAEPAYLARRSKSGEWLELLDASDWSAEMWVHGTDPVYTADQMRAAISANSARIAELIAADREYDEANAAHMELMQWAFSAAAVPMQEETAASTARVRTATARRASALAAVENQP